MSRILGVIDFNHKQTDISSILANIKAPMMHSPLYAAEEKVDGNSGFGRIYFKKNNLAAFLATDFESGVTCLFHGYITDLESLSSRVAKETNNKTRITNPAELISYLFAEKGAESLVDLNGIFSFALWNPKENSLWLGTDRYGMRPLYYLFRNNCVKFASEVKALSYSDPGLRTNLEAMEEMFTFGFLLGDKTIYENIFRVPPATVIKFSPEGCSRHRYWWFDRISIDPRLGVEDYLIENNHRFRNVMQRLSSGLSETSCLISSGYDSRRILLELTRLGKTVNTYTVAYSKAADKYEYEYKISQKLSAVLGTNHVAADYGAPEAQFEDILNMNSILDFESDEHQFIMPLLPKVPFEGAVNFDGIGGDILINGLFLQDDILSVIHDNNEVLKRIMTHIPYTWPAFFRYKSYHMTIQERILEILGDLPDSPNKLTLFFFLTRTRREISLFPYGLLSFKIESLLPYLDYDLVDQSLKLSPSLKFKTNLQEKILRLDYNDFMDRIPNSHYPGISSNPDEFCLPYCRPLGDYWVSTKRNVFSSAAKDVLKSGRFLLSLTPRSILLSVMFIILDNLNIMPKYVINKFWSLQSIGQLASLHLFSKNRKMKIERLNIARDYIFKSE